MRELGIASPEALRAAVRPSVLGTWAALYQIDPWGEERADLRSGIVASTVANAMAKKRGGGAFKPVDFMPYYEPPARDPEAMFRQMRAMLGGLKNRPGGKKGKRGS